MDFNSLQKNFTGNITSYFSNISITGNEQVDRMVGIQIAMQMTSIFSMFFGYLAVIIPCIFQLPLYIPKLYRWLISLN